MKITPGLIIYLLLSSHMAYGETQVRVYGEARDMDSTSLSYTEEHLISSAAHKVIYRQADNTLIAEKNIQYTQGYVTPGFQLYDHRFGRTSGSTWKNGEWLLWRQEKNGQRDEKTIGPHQNLVIDAGFNHFVLENFEALEQGNAIKFTFGITDPPMAIPMTIKKKDCSDAVYSSAGEAALCLRIATHNLIFRLFVPVIHLAYIHHSGDGISHLLSFYQGPSNLPGNDDKAQNVGINYRYEFLKDSD